MAFDPKEKAAQLRLQQARVKPAPRLPDSGQESARFPGQGNNSNQAGSPGDAARAKSQSLRNPAEMQKALKLAKQIGHGRRDKSKSLLSQGLGEAGAQGGRYLGGTIGSAVPVLGTAAGAIIGKRVGRVAGENWKITLGVVAAGISLNILLLITLVAVPILVVTATLEKSNTAAKILSPAYFLYDYLSKD